MTDTPRGGHLAVAPPPDDDERPGPPHDLAAERACLGAMMLSRQALEEVAELVSGPEFYRPAHELIYRAIVDLHLNGEPADAITVADELTRTGDIARAGGRAYLHDLMSAVPMTSNAGHYAAIVAEHAAVRRLQQHHQEALARIERRGDTPVRELYDADAQSLAKTATWLPSTAAGSPWEPVDLTDVLDGDETLEAPTLLARSDGQHLLYPAAVHSISGEPESGKTWVALVCAAQVLRDPDGRHVTYVDFEDRAGRVVPRLLALGAPRSAILERFHYIRPTAALDAAGRRLLDEVADASSYAVIDGVTEAMTMHGLSLLDNEDAARYLDLLPRHLADHGPAVLQVDHVVKDAESRGRYAVGAQHKLAGLDGAAYGIKVLDPFGRGKIGRAAISVHKDRPGAVREFALGNAVAHLVIDSRGEAMGAWLEEPQTMPKGPEGGLRPTHLMEKVSRYIEMSPGATRTQIEQGVTGKGTYVRMALDALVSEGYVTTTSGTRGAHNHSIVAVYREAEDDRS